MSTPIAIQLSVKSRDNVPMNYTGTFVVSKIDDLMVNQNETKSVTITDGDVTSQTSDWALYGNFREGQVLYYTVETVTGTTRRVRVYGNEGKTNLLMEGTAVIANNDDGFVYLDDLSSGLSLYSGQVKLTIGGSLTAIDKTLTLTDVTQSTNLQVTGKSQFLYDEGHTRKAKYTVTETVAAILLLMNPPSS